MIERPFFSARARKLSLPFAAAVFALVFLSPAPAGAQMVRVKFRYLPDGTYVRVHFPGQFNNWGPNSSGTIAAGAPSQADSLESSTGLWVKSVPLAFGTYQYKIYRQITATPTNWSWIPDPLNRIVLPPDQNSQFTVDSLVLFQICPVPYTIESEPGGSVFVVRTALPNLTAGIFRPSGAVAPGVEAWIDGVPVPGAVAYRDTSDGIFAYRPPVALPDGRHVFRLRVTAGTVSRTDSVTFDVRARPVQILTPPFSTVKSAYITGGIILKPDASGPDSSVMSASIRVNGISRPMAVVNGVFRDSTLLDEGANTIIVQSITGSDTVLVTRKVRHAPVARASAVRNGGTVTLDASGTTDPDSQQVSDFLWMDDPAYPLGLSGLTGVSVSVPTPPAAGEYYFGLVARDPDGNADTTRSLFIIVPNGSLVNPTSAHNPEWAKEARLYFLFPKAVSAAGTINAAALRLPVIRDLGFSVIWMMPVMDNAFPIDNGSGSGYNIVDFRNVAPEYGTNRDFKDFVALAHSLGMKVILDVTPNHSSRFHSWAADARLLGSMSPYWNWYEHSIIPHNDNGLGQSLDASGFNYYSAFTDNLLNLNWKDDDLRTEMADIYLYWIREFDLDGFRFDVTWGPHRRYGEQYMGMPLREALKHVKPDILLLAEDDGTGFGTERIYADHNGVNGGMDASYDFKLYFNNVRNFGFGNPIAVDALHANVDNDGYYPGPNALFMRFMESQDEDRIYYLNPSPSSYFDADTLLAFRKSMPMASVLFTAPGIPMIWTGQDVGWGYGIAGHKYARTRSVVNWDFAGRAVLSPHYQRLAHIRGQFRAFTQHKTDSNADGEVTALDVPDFLRVPSTNGLVYAFTRPYRDQNGLTVVNLSGTGQNTTLNLSGQNALRFTAGLQPGESYFLNNIYGGGTSVVTGTALTNLGLALPPYGTSIFTVSTTPDTLRIPNPVLDAGDENGLPEIAALHQNYPNPFNPSTRIRFEVPGAGWVTIRIFDILGREIVKLADGEWAAGTHELVWMGRTASGAPAVSGVYFARMEFSPPGVGAPAAYTRPMLLVR